MANLLVLGFLLSSRDFGFYSLNATNALIFQIIFGWWITSAAYKFLAHRDETLVNGFIATMAVAAAFTAVAASLVASLFVLKVSHYSTGTAGIVAIWTVALIGYDLTLAANNGLGNSRAYAALSMSRNLLALVFSTGLVVSGFGPMGAMIGQVAGLVLPLIFVRSANVMWQRAVVGRPSLEKCGELFRFGLAGMCVLGIYMLTQGVARNLVERTEGLASAGQFAFAIDIFNAPLLLIGTTFSLSRMRTLYRAGGDSDAARARDQSSNYVQLFLVLSIAYAAGGAVVGPSLSELFAHSSLAEGVASLSRPAAVIAACVQVVSALLTALLVADLRWRVILLTIMAVALSAIAILFAPWPGLTGTGWSFALALTILTALASLITIRSGAIELDARNLGLGVLSAGLCAGVSEICLLVLGHGIVQAFAAIAAGSAVFVVVTARFGVLDWSGILTGHAGTEPADK